MAMDEGLGRRISVGYLRIVLSVPELWLMRMPLSGLPTRHVRVMCFSLRQWWKEAWVMAAGAWGMLVQPFCRDWGN